MKQNHINNDTFLARWLSNDLSDNELKEFKESPDYSLYLKIAEKSKEFKVPVFNQEKVYQQIQLAIQKEKNKVKKLISTWVYGAAAAILLLIGVSFFFNQNNTIQVAKGQKLAYILPDGSTVNLNGQSSISFNEKKWKEGERELELEGEGYFKVKKGSAFSVHTEEGSVTVLGTQFNVQTIKNYLSVECYEGKVYVANGFLDTVLTPGKGVNFKDKTKKNYNIHWSQPDWVRNTYQYNGTPLSIVFKDLENVYGITVKNKNVDITQKYSGKLLNDDLTKAVEIIGKSMDINYKIKENTVTIDQ
ncbi:FecR family protein [Wenyingzhuangia sp. 2_MG-2023]|uniref:FecR family protein n=1 Tax=Wenyingzhuangia sp. 2_MG-2023 TaxID=3062639 RepID=UPI0026E2576F|nr:FecR family protein [Wenyingzhuangia sp. 2_MG-2023]MDO6736692.1 FecR family protein [Wenyingzhuangia sp. 2_MG-2023]